MPIERRKRLTPFPQDAEQQWEWLWRNAVYSTERLAKYIPSSDKELEQKLQALIANKVLYPDGTVNGYVERLLRARIMKTLSSAGRLPLRFRGLLRGQSLSLRLFWLVTPLWLPRKAGGARRCIGSNRPVNRMDQVLLTMNLFYILATYSLPSDLMCPPMPFASRSCSRGRIG